MNEQHFTTTYERTEEGNLRFTAATLGGAVFSMELSPGEGLENLKAFARAYGLVVALPV